MISPSLSSSWTWSMVTFCFANAFSENLHQTPRCRRQNGRVHQRICCNSFARWQIPFASHPSSKIWSGSIWVVLLASVKGKALSLEHTVSRFLWRVPPWYGTWGRRNSLPMGLPTVNWCIERPVQHVWHAGKIDIFSRFVWPVGNTGCSRPGVFLVFDARSRSSLSGWELTWQICCGSQRWVPFVLVKQFHKRSYRYIPFEQVVWTEEPLDRKVRIFVREWKERLVVLNIEVSAFPDLTVFNCYQHWPRIRVSLRTLLEPRIRPWWAELGRVLELL